MKNSGIIVCIDNKCIEGLLTLGKKYNYINIEHTQYNYHYHLIADNDTPRSFVEWRFKNITELRELKLNFLNEKGNMSEVLNVLFSNVDWMGISEKDINLK